MQYSDIKKDLPNPRLAINIGNALIQNSCNIAICIGCSSIPKSNLHVDPRYSGLLIILSK